MKKLLTILAALAILASGTANAQVAERLTAHRLDRPWTFSSFVAPTGCVSSSVPFFGADLKLTCDGGLTYDGTNKKLVVNRIGYNAYTTAQRDALTATAGDGIYNSTTGRFEVYDGAAWHARVRLDGDTMTGALTAPAVTDLSLGPVYVVTRAPYNAKADAWFALDAAMSNGSPTLTSHAPKNGNAGPFSSADVGKNITVKGAAAGSTLLTTTILSYQDSEHVTLAANAGASVSNVYAVWWTTDNTATIQAALTALQTSRGGKVVIPSGGSYGYYYSAAMTLEGASTEPNDALNAPIIEGDNAILIHPNAYLTGSITADSVFMVRYANNPTVRGLVFQGPNYANYGVSGSLIHMTAAVRGAVIENNIALNHFRGVNWDYSGTGRGWIRRNFSYKCGAAIQQSSGAGSADIDGNVVEAPYTTGIANIVYAAGPNTVVRGNFIEISTGSTGILFDTTATNGVATGNRFLNTGVGVPISGLKSTNAYGNSGETSVRGGATKTLTESSATAFVALTLANSETVAGRVVYTIIAKDATNTQGLSGELFFSAAADSSGTVTAATLSDQHNQNPCTSGTLTNTMDQTTGANTLTLRANAVSSLTQTTLEIRYRVELLAGTAAVAAQ